MSLVPPRKVELSADADSTSMVRIQCNHGIEVLVTPLLLVLVSRFKDESERHVT